MQKEPTGDVTEALRDSLGTSPRGMEISVVVATFNRRPLLERLLESLDRQTLSPAAFEVIVVSDGATDGTVEMVRTLQKRWHRLELLDLENRGPGAARNAGARVARGRYLAFTDDDCVAAPDWLEKLLAAFDKSGAIAVQGRTTTDRPARSPFTHEIEILSPMLTSMPTCNAAYRKDVFAAVGGFDESFRFAHDEDADLAWRVEEIGRIVFAAEAQVIHPPRRERFWTRARWVRGLESEFLLFRKNPGKYRQYVSPSPWRTIYWKIFVVGQIQIAIANCKYLIRPFKPGYFVVGVGLVLARWFNLIRFLPAYHRAQRACRGQASSADDQGPSREPGTTS